MLTKLTDDNILYEDDDVIAVHKPSGTATQTKKAGEKDIYTLTMNYIASKYRANKQKAFPYVAIINRLDQPVEGIVLMAKNSKSASALSASLQNNEISKYYIATIYKNGESLEAADFPRKGRLEDYIVKNQNENTSAICDSNVDGAKKAVLEYEVKEETDKTALLDIHLITGRHHQIRVQFAHAGYPLIGDLKYGNGDSIEYSHSINCSNVMLKAYKIEFNHPKTGQNIKIQL